MNPDDRRDMERFVFHLWRSVDYGAQRLQQEIAAKTRGLRTIEEQRLEAQASAPPEPIKATKAADTIIVDLTRVAEALRADQLKAIQSLPQVQNIEKVQDAGLYRIQYAGPAYEFHKVLKALDALSSFDVLGNKADWSVATISPKASQP
jgi:hypothetical protein